MQRQPLTPQEKKARNFAKRQRKKLRKQQANANIQSKGPGSNNSNPAQRRMPMPQRQRAPRPRRSSAIEVSGARLSSLSSGFAPRTLLKGVPSSSNNEVTNYVCALVDPSTCVSHVPTSFSKRSAIVQSILEFEVTANQVMGSANNGNFSFMVTPILGSTDNPTHYKVLLVDSTGGWPTDVNVAFSSPQAYVRLVNQLDIRIDPNKARLTAPDPGFWQGTAPNAAASGPLGKMPTDQASYDIPVVIFDAPAGFPTSSLIYTPPGVYFVHITLVAAPASMPTAVTISALNETISIQNNSFQAGAGALDSYQTIDLVISVPPNTFGFQNQGVLLTFGAGDVFTAGTSDARVTITPAYPELSQLVTPQPDQMDSGYVDEMRPVAMSVLATALQPTLTNGGDICIAYLPPESKTQRYLSDNSGTGNFQYFNTLSTVPGNYSGKLKDGAYAWWGPTDQSHIDFYPPTKMNTIDYPTICCSGSWQPGTVPAASANSKILRVIVITTFEILSDQMFLPMEIHTGTQAMMDEAFSILKSQQKCYPNGKHLDWLKNFFASLKRGGQKALEFYGNNKSWINPAVGSVLSLI